MACLELANVSYRYPDTNHKVLDSISCTLESGSLIALAGNNGSGKSTLARLMSGLLTPTEGSVHIDGEPLKEGWNGVGYIFQNPEEQLISQQVERELAWGLENLNLPASDIELRVEEGLFYFGLQDRRSQPPECLSDGEKQLVAIASMWVMKPGFMILDEATAFLDPLWKKRLWEVVRQWSNTTGILWITANMEEARTADVVWLLDRGRIVDSGIPGEILTDKRRLSLD